MSAPTRPAVFVHGRAHAGAVADRHEFPDRGHCVVVDRGWPEVADTVLAWLRSQSI